MRGSSFGRLRQLKQSKTMICSVCQRKIDDSSTVCPVCGKRLAPSRQSAPPPVSPSPSGPSESGNCHGSGSAPTGGMTFGRAIGTCFFKYFDFSGRASRAEFWYWCLFTALCGSACLLLELEGFYVLYSFAVCFPGLAVAARRMHDSGHTGWNCLWIFTGIGAFYVLHLYLKPTETVPNKYGPPPQSRDFAG